MDIGDQNLISFSVQYGESNRDCDTRGCPDDREVESLPVFQVFPRQGAEGDLHLYEVQRLRLLRGEDEGRIHCGHFFFFEMYASENIPLSPLLINL